AGSAVTQRTATYTPTRGRPGPDRRSRTTLDQGIEGSNPSSPANLRARNEPGPAYADPGVFLANQRRSVHRHPRPVQLQSGLADVDLEDLPGVGVVARFEVAVGDEQLVADEGETPRREEARIG